MRLSSLSVLSITFLLMSQVHRLVYASSLANSTLNVQFLLSWLIGYHWFRIRVWLAFYTYLTRSLVGYAMSTSWKTSLPGTGPTRRRCVVRRGCLTWCSAFEWWQEGARAPSLKSLKYWCSPISFQKISLFDISQPTLPYLTLPYPPFSSRLFSSLHCLLIQGMFSTSPFITLCMCCQSFPSIC